MSQLYASVAVLAPLPGAAEGILTYRVPSHLSSAMVEGALVWVPLGRRRVQGVVISLLDEPPAGLRGLREIEGFGDLEVVVPQPQLRLARWLAAEYYAPLHEALSLVLPPGIGQELETTWRATAAGLTVDLGALPEPDRAVLYLLRREGELSESELRSQLRGRDAELRRIYADLHERGLIAQSSRISLPRVRPQRELVVRLLLSQAEFEAALEALRRAPRQAALLQALAERMVKDEILPLADLRDTGATPALLRALASRGFIEMAERDLWRDPLAGREIRPEAPPELTSEQLRAWEAIRALLDAGDPQVALLYGVTGSGKTEIYLRAIARALRLGRQALVLVPEIALTTQLVRRFAARFPGLLAVLHSGLSLGERYDQWRRLRRGEARIAIGSRSAVFAPLAEVGLIVVDEEHDPSYKHEAHPHYHARDVALQLGAMSRSLVILGSATPAVESFYAARQERYRLLTLRERIGGRGSGDLAARTIPLPAVRVVDMREELRAGNRSPFSRLLQRSLEQVLSRGEQAILFLNRRGSASGVLCRDCGYTIGCPRCSVPLVVHEDDNGASRTPPLLCCHYCGHTELLPIHCPQCWSRRIRQFGVGTQRIAEEVSGLFPGARVLRWDRDVTGRKGSHDAILDTLLQRRADVLVGTQMVAKGLDLPLVTLVGVVAADTGLHLPDFRAAERTFQLLAQVAGRAGRRKEGGTVLIQTYNPEHYAIRAAQEHDYESFYREEIAFRRAANYPPFSRLVRFVYTHSNAAACQQAAEELSRLVRAILERRRVRGWGLIGPAPAFLQRLRGRYRWQLLVRLPDPVLLLPHLQLHRGWSVDVDPAHML